jgi:hypothetical protein
MSDKRSAIYGTLTRPNGHSESVPIEPVVGDLSDKAGYAPEALDPVVQVIIRNNEIVSGLLLKYTPILAKLMERVEVEVRVQLEMDPDNACEKCKTLVDPRNFSIAANVAEKVSIILDRLNKMMYQGVRSMDDATRLRTFLKVGDSDDFGGLKTLSESQLRKIVSDAAAGWAKEPEADE